MFVARTYTRSHHTAGRHNSDSSYLIRIHNTCVCIRLALAPALGHSFSLARSFSSMAHFVFACVPPMRAFLRKTYF